MSNGFKKAVGLLVSASLLASLAATAFAGTAAAAVTPGGATATVAGDQAWTPLGGTTLTLDGVNDITAPYPGANLRFVLGNGFELNPNAAITVNRNTGDLLFGDTAPGAISVQVNADSSGQFFDVPIWHSSGDATTTNVVINFLGIQVRQRHNAQANGDVVTINHNTTDPGDVVMQPVTLYTLTGGAGTITTSFQIGINNSSWMAGTANPQATAGLIAGSARAWNGDTVADPTTLNWTTNCPGATMNPVTSVFPAAMQSDVYDCNKAGDWTVTATIPGGASASVGFSVYASPVVKSVHVQTVDGIDSSSSALDRTMSVGDTHQMIAICYDAWGNEIARTGDDGNRGNPHAEYNCYGDWSIAPLTNVASINYTGLFKALRPGTVDNVVYTVPADGLGDPNAKVSGSAGPWYVLAGTFVGVWKGAAVQDGYNPASPVVRAGGFSTTGALYSYHEPEWLSPTYSLPLISGVGLFPADGFTWWIDIADAQGRHDTVHFDTSKAPTLVSPDSVNTVDSGCGAKFLTDYRLQITVCNTNPFQIESISVSGLQVKADANAALGDMITTYGLSTNQFTFGGQLGGYIVYGRLYADYAVGVTSVFATDIVNGPFQPTSGEAGALNFTDSTWAGDALGGGTSTESVSIATASSLSLGAQTLKLATPTTKAHSKGTWVWQQINGPYSCLMNEFPLGEHSFGVCALPTIATVKDSLKLSAGTEMVQRGLPNRLPVGTLILQERTTGAEGNGTSAGRLSANTVISVKLDSAAGVVFSEPPTAKVTWTKAAALGELCRYYLLTDNQVDDRVMPPCHPGSDLWGGGDWLLRGALEVPYTWYYWTADFGPTASGSGGHGNLFINDDPYSFENRKAIAPTDNSSATVTPSTSFDHPAGVAVGQDVYGMAGGVIFPDPDLLGSNQAPLTLYNPSQDANAYGNSTYPSYGPMDPKNYANITYVSDLSPDRLTATFKVRTADIGWVTSALLIDAYVDVSASAAAGQAIAITVETGTGTAAAGVKAAASTIPVIGSPVTVGYTNNTVDGTAQAVPSVVIGANDQATGTVVIREAAAGMIGGSNFTGTVATNNVLRVCNVSSTGKPETFTRAPWLVVTNGDLKIRANSDPTIPSGVAAPGTGVRGYLGMGGGYCAQWIVANVSTTASTLEIRGSASDGTMLAAGPNNGPHVNVDAQQVPGPVTMSLWQIPYSSWETIGNTTYYYCPATSNSTNTGTGPWQYCNLGAIPASWTDFDLVQYATRVYGANVAVAAVSQPELKKGGLNQPAGDVTITESATFQLGNYAWYLNQQWIWFQIVPNNMRDVLPSVYFNTDRVAPVVSTNSSESGLIAHFGRWWNNTTFTVVTDQRAFVPVAGAWVPGKITVSGLAYSVTNDAALGPVQLQVCSNGLNSSTWTDANYHAGSPVCPGIRPAAENPANFNQTVSNAKVVEQSAILGAIAPGVAGPGTNKWRFNTVMVTSGKYITLRLQAVKGAVVGDRIEIWGRAGKTGTWKKLTTRTVGANGYIFYFKKITGYTEFQALFPGSDTASASYAVPRYYRATVGTAAQVAKWNKTHAN